MYKKNSIDNFKNRYLIIINNDDEITKINFYRKFFILNYKIK